MEIVIIFIIWLVLGASTAFLANQRGRDPLLWSLALLTMSLFGLPFALMGLAFLYFLPVKDEEDVPEKHEFEDSRSLHSSELPLAQILSSSWYYYDSLRRQHGPLSFQELQQAWKKGEINKESYVWADGIVGWKKVYNLPEVVEALDCQTSVL